MSIESNQDRSIYTDVHAYMHAWKYTYDAQCPARVTNPLNKDSFEDKTGQVMEFWFFRNAKNRRQMGFQ